MLTGYLVKASLWIFNQFKGNKSCTVDACMTKLYDHCNVMTIQNCCKFHELPFTGYLVMTLFVDFKQFKGNNSLHTGACLMKYKIYVHQCVMVIHI